MLLSFSVKNFKSFKDEALIDMHAANIDEYTGINTFNDPKEEQVLKGAYIFGPNSAGKTNLFKGISLMKAVVLDSFSNNNLLNRIYENDNMYFLFNQKCENLPIEFKCEFKTENYYYRYSFSILKSKIYQERLERKLDRYSLIFDRNSNKEITGSKKYVSRIKKFVNNIRDNALIVSVMTALNDSEFKDVYDWFADMIIVSGDRGSFRHFNNNDLKPYLKYVQLADKTIVDLSTSTREISQKEEEELKKIFSEKQIESLKKNMNKVINLTKHNIYNDKKEKVGETDVSLQKYASIGTINFMALLVPIFHALEKGALICVDELDSKIHVSLVNYIIELFNSIDKNPKNAQIVATTHDVFLLDEKIRRDQVILVDKDVYGESDIYSLVDIKGVKKRDNFLKKYLLGYYGATPSIKDLDLGDE